MKNKTVPGILVLIFVSALAYLPLINWLGYAYDDWYLMYTVGAYGPAAFLKIFSVDRPMRALVMIPTYELFGSNPLYYNLSAYVFRALGALVFLGILNILWPGGRRMNALAAALFVIYPGFLSQPNGLDYQSHILGLAAALFSIYSTVCAIIAGRFIQKTGWHALAVLTAVLYLGQMEWYIGFEFFRWACVAVLVMRAGGTFRQKVIRALQWAYPALFGPVLFLLWRLFFFKSERGATDVDLQLGQLLQYPLQTSYHWIVQISQDLFDVLFSAWVIPFSQLNGYIQRWGGVLALIVAGVVLFALQKMEDNSQSEPSQTHAAQEWLWVGLATAIGGLIPIAMVNRDVSFPHFSRYALVSSVGAVILISLAVSNLTPRLVRHGLIGMLIFTAVLTHHANTVKYVQERAAMNNFWWQVSWRVPQFEKGATLIAAYPTISALEDYFIWGPANLIYYPEKQNEKNLQPGVFAAIVNPETVVKVLTRERQEYDKRKNIITYANYRNMVILTQPIGSACVRVIDGTRPENSATDWDSIRVMSPYSEIEHILADATPHTPPGLVFGPEPAHGWCFYYQKADLARQRGDWANVISIGAEAFQKGFAPADPIEWLPFLQAYALSGDIQRLTELAAQVGRESDPYVASQACRILIDTPGISQEVVDVVDTLYCPE